MPALSTWLVNSGFVTVQTQPSLHHLAILIYKFVLGLKTIGQLEILLFPSLFSLLYRVDMDWLS